MLRREFSANRRAAAFGAVTDPNLRSFAAELEAKFPSSSLNQSSQALRELESVADSPRDLFRQPMEGGPRQLDTVDGAVGDRSVGNRSFSASQEGSICRPRAIPKTTPLAVACVVSRMGFANRERKRRTAARLAQKFSRSYSVLPVSDSSENSAFRVIVSKPCPISSTIRPQETTRSNISSTWGASGGEALEDFSTAVSEKRGRVNNVSTYSMGLGVSINDNTYANISGLGTSLEAVNGSTLSRRTHAMNETMSSVIAMDRSLSAKEFSERALSSINSALQPLRDPREKGVSARPPRDHFTPVDGSFAGEASCPASMRVGEKRVRDSFAPEPCSTRKVIRCHSNIRG